MDYQEYLDQYVSYDKVLVRRCWAAVLDYFLYSAIVVLYSYFFGEVQQWGFREGFNADAGLLVPMAIWVLYFPGAEAVFGYTLGKGLFDLKVVRERKADFPLFVTFKRHMLDLIEFSSMGLIAILMVKFTKDHKRIGDFLAHSRVVLES